MKTLEGNGSAVEILHEGREIIISGTKSAIEALLNATGIVDLFTIEE